MRSLALASVGQVRKPVLRTLINPPALTLFGRLSHPAVDEFPDLLPDDGSPLRLRVVNRLGLRLLDVGDCLLANVGQTLVRRFSGLPQQREEWSAARPEMPGRLSHRRQWGRL